MSNSKQKGTIMKSIRQDLNEKCKMRTKLYDDIFKHFVANLPEDYWATQGNINQVLQWGNMAKIIFVYMLNPQIHTEQMDSKVALFKDLGLQISIAKNTNIQQKVLNNLGFADWQRTVELILQSKEDNAPYITQQQIGDILKEISHNPRLQRFVSKRKREGFDILDFLNKCLKDPLFEAKADFSIALDNQIAADRALNKSQPIPKQVLLYRELVAKETNPLIQKIIKENEVIR